MSLSTYKKRSGTSDRGKDYEWLLCAYYSLKFSLSTEVADFELYTNNEFFGDFDDIALRVKFLDGSIKVFLLQLKHSEKAKTLALNSLSSPSGDFTLLKYKKSYDAILNLDNFDFILYTNRTAKFKDKTKIIVEEQEVDIRQFNSPGNLLNTNKGGNCSVFKFEINQKWDFFKNFYLYVNQQNDINLKQSISDLLNSKLHCDIYTSFIEFMRGWWAGNFKLTKYDVGAKLAELVFSPMVKTLDGGECNHNTKLIEEAILKFDMTLVEGLKITKIWTKISEGRDMKRVSLTALKYGLTTKGIGKMEELSLEKQSKVLWFMDEVPLVIEVDMDKKEAVEAMISVLGGYKTKKKIILMGTVGQFSFPNWKIFQNVTNLSKGDDLYQMITKSFTCSLQGKLPISLEEIGVYKEFGVDQLLEIATNEDFVIGGPLETLPPSYISRFFYKIILNYSVIDGLSDSRILLSCNGQKDTVQTKIKKRTVGLSCCHSGVENFPKHYIFASETEFSKEIVESTFSDKKGEYHLRVIDGQNLQWLNSSSPSYEDISKYKKINLHQTLSEDEIDNHFHNRIKILTSHTGNGKTSFLKRIKNQSPPNCVVIYVNLKEHSEFFKNEYRGTKVWNYLVDHVTKNNFESNLMKASPQSRRIILWDGFDELRPESRQNFLSCCKDIRTAGATQWITSKNRFQEVLEKKLQVFAMVMLPFQEQDQVAYIKNRCGVTDVSMIANFYQNIKILDDREYLGVPLQLYIITDIFNKEPKLLETIFTLTDMFRAFIEGKYNHYLKKSSCKNDFDLLGKLIEDGKDHRLDQYKIAALRTHLPDLCQKLNLKNSGRFLDDVKSGDFLGLILSGNPEEGFIFEHQIIGEYLTALHLSENLHLELSRFLFDEKNRNIRFLFDLLLAEDKTSFVSILYRKFIEIEDFEVRDRAGRSPLHLICSYGEKHSLLRADNESIEPSRGDSVRGDSESFKAKVREISQKCDPFERDTLFGFNSFEYADRALCLNVIEILGGDLNRVLPTLSNYNDLPTVLYYSIKFDYRNLFKAIDKEAPFVQDTGGGNLIHVATEFQREEFLTWLLSQKIYLKSINKLNGNKWTPIHIASFNGNLTLLKFLKDKGGTFPTRDPSAVSLATTHGYKQVIEFLLECSCSPNDFYHANYFTQSLPLAITRGYVEIVDFLITNGAKFYRIAKNHMNALHLALEHEQFEIAELLLQWIKIEDVDGTGKNNYHHAAINNQESVVLFLLEKGANHRVTDKKNRYPLHWAAQSGSVEVARILIREGAEIDATDVDHATPLHLAVTSGQLPLVSLLLNAKADPNFPNRYKRTAVHLAALNDLSEMIEVLYENGADLELEDSLYKRRPLHYAAWFGHESSVRVLIDKGVNVHASCNFGYTPLHLAAEEDSVECCQILIEKGARIDVESREGITPLIKANSHQVLMTMLPFHPLPVHYAGKHAKSDAVLELLAMGYDVNAIDENGATPLHHCVNCYFSNTIAQILLDKGADVNKKDNDGYSPLHYALQARFVKMETMELLLGDINIKTNNGLTPLHLAARITDEIFVESLLNKGARFDVEDDVGYTPLHYAIQSGTLSTVKLLIEKELTVDKPNKYGRTPLHMAATQGHLHIVQFLLDHQASVFVQDQDGDTPLNDALKSEHVEVFRLLWNHNSDFDIATVNPKGRNVLHMSAKKGSIDLVEFFLAKNVPLDVADLDGVTPLEEALYNRQYKIFDFLLPLTDFDVNKFNRRQKCYPIHLVATHAKEDLVQLFLQKGAKVDVVDDDGNTPLHHSIIYEHEEIFPLLAKNNPEALNIRNKKGQTVLHLATIYKNLLEPVIDQGPDVTITDNNGKTPFELLFNNDNWWFPEKLLLGLDIDVNQQNSNGQTFLHKAAKYGQIDVVKWLIEKGARVDTVDHEGETPLFVAVHYSESVSRLLLEKFKTVINLHQTNHKGESLLHVAVDRCPNLVKDLINLGAPFDTPTKRGYTPLLYALKEENCEIFQFLWGKSPEVDLSNMATDDGRTPLHMAAKKGKLFLSNSFLKKGLKINEADRYGNTPLDDALAEGHLTIFQILLEQDKGVVNGSNRNGSTLLHEAVKAGKFDFVTLLVAKGARLDLCDRDGMTASEVALQEENMEIFEFLKEREDTASE